MGETKLLPPQSTNVDHNNNNNNNNNSHNSNNTADNGASTIMMDQNGHHHHQINHINNRSRNHQSAPQVLMLVKHQERQQQQQPESCSTSARTNRRRLIPNQQQHRDNNIVGHNSGSSSGNSSSSTPKLFDITSPKTLFSCVSQSNNLTEESAKRSLSLLKLLLEYQKRKKRLPYLDACEVSLSPVISKQKGNICMYALCQNNVAALKLLLNYSLTVDMFNFSLVQIVVNSIYAFQQKYRMPVRNTTEMLEYLEEEFGRNIVYDYVNRRQRVSLETPLHVACAIGDVQLVKLLLENGAAKSIHSLDFLGQSPLHVALAHCDRPENTLELAQLLVQYGGMGKDTGRRLLKENAELWIQKSPLHFQPKLREILGTDLWGVIEEKHRRSIHEQLHLCSSRSTMSSSSSFTTATTSATTTTTIAAAASQQPQKKRHSPRSLFHRIKHHHRH